MKVTDEFNDYAQNELNVHIKVPMIKDKKDAISTLKDAKDILNSGSLNDIAS